MVKKNYQLNNTLKTRPRLTLHLLVGHHVFLQMCYFYGNIVINYSYLCVYSKILENDFPIAVLR